MSVQVNLFVLVMCVQVNLFDLVMFAKLHGLRALRDLHDLVPRASHTLCALESHVFHAFVAHVPLTDFVFVQHVLPVLRALEHHVLRTLYDHVSRASCTTCSRVSHATLVSSNIVEVISTVLNFLFFL